MRLISGEVVSVPIQRTHLRTLEAFTDGFGPLFTTAGFEGTEPDRVFRGASGSRVGRPSPQPEERCHEMSNSTPSPAFVVSLSIPVPSGFIV